MQQRRLQLLTEKGMFWPHSVGRIAFLMHKVEMCEALLKKGCTNSNYRETHCGRGKLGCSSKIKCDSGATYKHGLFLMLK